MTCCRCNRTGRCLNCSCVKSGRPCQSCLPQRLENCANTVQTQPSPPAPVDTSTQPLFPLPTPNRVPETPLSCLPPSTTVLDTSPKPSSPLQQSSPLTSISEPSQWVSATRAPENVSVQLPQFTPVADPVFIWSDHDLESFTHSR